VSRSAEMANDIPDGPWVVAQGDYNGRPLFARINTGARGMAGDPGYGHRVGVAVPLLDPNADGLPGPEESAQLDEVEQKLVPALTSGGTAVFVLAITTSGMREFVFYTSKPAAVEPCLQRVSALVETHELEHVVEEDPAWVVFEQFARSTDVA